MFKSDSAEYLPWDYTANIQINGSKHEIEEKRGYRNHSNIVHHFVHCHSSDKDSVRHESSIIGSSPKAVSLPHFLIGNAARSDDDDDDDLSRLDTNKSFHTESDASVVSSVPSLASSSERSPSPSSSSSLDDLSQCDEQTKVDDLLHCEETLAPFIEERWNLRYKELLEFMKANGHTNVPHTYLKNQQLGRWVKRQRHQYKLLRDGKPSAMTPERIEILDSCGFVWDSHELTWREKVRDLQAFFGKHGHCNVQTKYKENKKLGTWVKCQRRQYKLYRKGKPSAMDSNRVKELESMGFEWEIRKR